MNPEGTGIHILVALQNLNKLSNLPFFFLLEWGPDLQPLGWKVMSITVVEPTLQADFQVN